MYFLMAKNIKISLVIIPDINIFDNIFIGHTINNIDIVWKTKNLPLGTYYTFFFNFYKLTESSFHCISKSRLKMLVL